MKGTTDGRMTEVGQRITTVDAAQGGPPPADVPQPVSTVRLAVGLGAVALVIVILGGVAGLAFALVSPNVYEARVEIRYDITSEQPTSFLREDRTLTTQVVLLRSHAVLGTVAEAFGIPVRDLEENARAEVIQTSEIIEIKVRDESRERAHSLAGAILERYLGLSADTDADDVRAYIEREIATVRAAQSRIPAAAQGSLEASALRAREQELLSRLDEVNLSGGGPSPEVVAAPYTLELPVSPSGRFYALTGMLAGLLVAAGVVALQARRILRQGRARTGGPRESG